MYLPTRSQCGVKSWAVGSTVSSFKEKKKNRTNGQLGAMNWFKMEILPVVSYGTLMWKYVGMDMDMQHEYKHEQ